MDKIDVAVRIYNRLKDNPNANSYTGEREKDTTNYNRWFTFDTETRNDFRQALTFGSFVIKNGNAVEKIGLFYSEVEVTANELKVLQDYCKSDPTIKLYTMKEFIWLFYQEIYTNKTVCTAFNLPFDISRLATDFGYAKGWMHGGFTFRLSDNDKYPQIKVKRTTTSESTVQFQGTRYGKFRGNFIDCQQLAVILTDRKRISLKEACEEFNKIYKKIEAGEHGKITKEYIHYNINDTLATSELYSNLKKEYNLYGVSLPLKDAYSSATMGKSFLSDLGIMPFMKLNPNFPPEMLGKLSQAYYGGRCECRKRVSPTLVTVLDFTSQYPSLNLLLGLYDFLIAEKIEYLDDTENVKKLLDDITLDSLRDPNTWKQLNVLIEIEPDDDLLSVRAEYNKDAFTVGLNHITHNESLYYRLPSIILSKLVTGKTPKIKKAIRFIPVGKQKTLKKATILGIEIDPNVDNIFRILVQERHRCKKTGDKKEKCIKIIANSTSYGIYMELNREEKNSDLIVYSGNQVFPKNKRFEKEGKYYHPLIATFVTDGAKLLLGLIDCILKQYGNDQVTFYTDTDSAFISPQYSKSVIEFFDSLNPYNNVNHLLKTVEENIWFYGISAKRYVLYDMDKNGNFVIKDDEKGDENYSLHGLGHLSNPFGKDTKHWQKEIWLDILRLQYKKISDNEFLDKYKNFYAVAKFTVSTARLMKRFRVLNKGKSYNDKIKPFNFFLIGFGNVKNVKPISPSKEPQEMPYGEFINYRNGKLMKGQEYFKTLASELWSYVSHPESKLNGNEGILERKHILANKIIYMGKEADKVEENMCGLDNVDYNLYNNPKDAEKILSLKWNDVKDKGISKRHLRRIKKQLREGKIPNLKDKTLKRLLSLYLGE